MYICTFIQLLCISVKNHKIICQIDTSKLLTFNDFKLRVHKIFLQLYKCTIKLFLERLTREKIIKFKDYFKMVCL